MPRNHLPSTPAVSNPSPSCARALAVRQRSPKAAGGAARSEREHSEVLIPAHSVAAAQAAAARRLRVPVHSSRARRRAEDRRRPGRCCRCLYAAYRRRGCWAVGWRKGARIGAVLGWDGMGAAQAHAAHAGGAGDCTEVRAGSESSGERESTPQMVSRRAGTGRKWRG
jgi:hypothetical protein